MDNNQAMLEALKRLSPAKLAARVPAWAKFHDLGKPPVPWAGKPAKFPQRVTVRKTREKTHYPPASLKAVAAYVRKFERKNGLVVVPRKPRTVKPLPLPFERAEQSQRRAA